MSTDFGDCFFLQAVSGDQGAHDSSGVWWLSPDVRLFDPMHELDTNGQYLYQNNPVPGTQYHWAVGVNRKASCASLPTDLVVCAELWIGFPGLFFQPNVNCVQLNSAVCAPPPTAGAAIGGERPRLTGRLQPTLMQWTVPVTGAC